MQTTNGGKRLEEYRSRRLRGDWVVPRETKAVFSAVLDRVRLRKHLVDFLQREALRLHDEKVDHEDFERVPDDEDQVN